MLSHDILYVVSVRSLWYGSSCGIGERGAGVAFGILSGSDRSTTLPSIVMELFSFGDGFCDPRLLAHFMNCCVLTRHDYAAAGGAPAAGAACGPALASASPGFGVPR